MACFNDFELTDTVKTEGTWSFYAGYNVFSAVDPWTTVIFDTAESASSDKDCTITLSGGTFTNFLLGNRRFSGSAPFGTYSGNMTAVIGKKVSFASGATYRAINGHNYVTGSVDVTVNSWPTGETIDAFAPTGAMTGGIAYDAAANTGKTTITKGELTAETIVIKMTLGQKQYIQNGETVAMDVAPQVVNGRTMLPARAIAEALGAIVGWDGDLSAATFTNDTTVIKIIIGSDVAIVNDEEVKLDAAAFIEDGRTFLPLRFICETLGATVDWDTATSTATITK